MGETARPAGSFFETEHAHAVHEDDPTAQAIPGEFQLKSLRLLRLEELQESRMLGEERFDFKDARAGPILEPGFAEVVLDLVKAAFTHGLNIGRVAGRRHGPNGSFEGS